MKTNLATMTLMCIYMFKLALGNDFVYYIHPRYTVFSIIATLVCSFVVLKIWRHSHEIRSHKGKRSGLLSFLIICILVTAIILPAQGLTTATALKRFNGSNQTITIRNETKESRPKEKASPFIVMPRSDDPGDIFSSFVFNLENADDLEAFKDAEVELVGFVLIDSTDGTSKYHVSRFFIACCTADATPIGIPFQYSGSEYKNDDWVKVKGKLKFMKQDGFEKAIIMPSSIEKIPEPEFPYAYY